jgi:SAM-dependent methyltransferase
MAAEIEMDHLYLNGREYDLMFPEPPALALSFLSEQARLNGHSILELACGTGRVALPLAQAGFQVTGIDLSHAMLAEAIRKATQEVIAVEWVEADMRNFDLDRQFHTIILVANALAHLLTLADFEACMACVRKHLATQGRLILHAFMPSLSILTQQLHERHSFAAFQDLEAGGEVVVTYSNQYETDTQINRVTTHYTYPGRAQQIGGALNLRMYFPQELDALLKYNGFHIEHKFGDFDRRPFDAQAKTQLLVCWAQKA